MIGGGHLGAEQRPGAGAQERAVRPPATAATADPVSWHAGATTGVPSAARTHPYPCARARSRLHDRRQQAGRDVELQERGVGPVARSRIHQLGRRRVGVLGARVPVSQ